MLTRHLKRKIRVLRLLAVVQAFHCYTMMQLNRKVLDCENSWEEAEHLSQWIGAIMPYKECSPNDFMYDKNEISDTVLNHYDEFKLWIKVAETVGISEKTLTAFCKNVENLQSVFRLKALGHIFYSDWLMAMCLYLNNTISKTELQNSFVEYSMFTGKSQPANFAIFRKVILEIEQNILEISHKQICRDVRN